MEGGATGGYCAIGNCVIATPPITRMNSAITQAKIGRSMKNLAMLRLLRVWRRAGCGSGGCRQPVRRRADHGTGFTGRARTQLLEAVDHDLLAGLQAIEDDPLARLLAADLDGARC